MIPCRDAGNFSKGEKERDAEDQTGRGKSCGPECGRKDVMFRQLPKLVGKEVYWGRTRSDSERGVARSAKEKAAKKISPSKLIFSFAKNGFAQKGKRT